MTLTVMLSKPFVIRLVYFRLLEKLGCLIVMIGDKVVDSMCQFKQHFKISIRSLGF